MAENETYVRPKPTSTTALGIGGLVCGIIAFITAWIPLVNFVTIYFAVAGLVLSILGLIFVLQGKKFGKAVSIVGIIVSTVALIAVFIMQIVYFAVFYEMATSPEEVTVIEEEVEEVAED